MRLGCGESLSQGRIMARMKFIQVGQDLRAVIAMALPGIKIGHRSPIAIRDLVLADVLAAAADIPDAGFGIGLVGVGGFHFRPPGLG